MSRGYVLFAIAFHFFARCCCSASLSTLLLNPSFEDGLSSWAHDSNTYPVGTSDQPIGTDGHTSANLGTFDQPGSFLSQNLNLRAGRSYVLRFKLAANAGRMTGVPATVEVSLETSTGIVKKERFSALSSDFYGEGLTFVQCEVGFSSPPVSGSLSLVFRDVSANSGLGVDCVVDAIDLSERDLASPPLILQQPSDVVAPYGGSVALFVQVQSEAGLSFQWSHNERPIEGGTNRVFIVRALRPGDEGAYRVRVSAGEATTLSQPANVRVQELSGLIQNGSFEEGLLNWDYDGSVVELDAGVDGLKSANLGTFDSPNSHLSQWFHPPYCSPYVIGFSSAANAVYEVGVESRLEVLLRSVDGTLLEARVFTSVSEGFPGGSKGFRHHTIEVPAGRSDDLVELVFRDVSSNGGIGVDQMIDNVRIFRGVGSNEPVLSVPLLRPDGVGLEDSLDLSVLSRVQEVYSNQFFPRVPVRILGVRYATEPQSPSPFSEVVDSLHLELSTTLRSAGELDLEFGNNAGPDLKVVYDGPWALSSHEDESPSGPGGFGSLVSFKEPYLYDPSKGNLLVEARWQGRLTKSAKLAAFRDARVQRLSALDGKSSIGSTNAHGVATVLLFSYCPDNASLPRITTQPVSKLALVGNPAEFTVSALGAEPLHFQWFKDGQPLAAGTNALLVVPEASKSTEGLYHVAVSNWFGTIVSEIVALRLRYPPSFISITDIFADAGRVVTVPVEVFLRGVEARLGFSLTYPTNLLRFRSARIPFNPFGTPLDLNLSKVAAGSVGLILTELPSSESRASQRLMLELEFEVSSSLRSNEVGRLAFANSPVVQEVFDVVGNPVDVIFRDARLEIVFPGLEADVSPSPIPDNTFSLQDWLQVGRYVAGLEPVPNVEFFKRIDCAPRAHAGDGVLTVGDWVQAGRFLAALDLPMLAAGPTNGLFPDVQPLSVPPITQIEIGERYEDADGITIAPVILRASGKEAGLGFSLHFDPRQFVFVGSSPGRGAARSKLYLNDQAKLYGRIGLVLAPLQGFLAETGVHEMVKLKFRKVSQSISLGDFRFSNVPIAMQVANADGEPIDSAYTGPGTRVDISSPFLDIQDLGDQVQVEWNGVPQTSMLEVCRLRPQGGLEWVPVEETPHSFGSKRFVLIPKTASGNLFRLRLP